MQCPICDSQNVELFLALEDMPLSVLNLPTSAKQSLALERHRIHMCQCLVCGHVFNDGYDPNYTQVFDGGCTMYNSGDNWVSHMVNVAAYVTDLSARGRIVEIGAGNGEFARMCDSRDYIAYEPTDDALECGKHVVDTRQRHFIPEEDLQKDKPSVIVMRHVLEHFIYPGEFLSDLYRHGMGQEQASLVVEVPNVQNALDRVRIEDWVYEHPHHFTANSLITLANKSGWVVTKCHERYRGEVLVATMFPRISPVIKQRSREFHNMLGNLNHAALKLRRIGKVALWGAAGKGATMIHALSLKIAPVIVDSDKRKFGKFVPGTPYQICEPAILHVLRPDVVVVTTAWRVGDIAKEIKQRNLPVGQVMYFDNGNLKTYEG